MDEPEVIRLSWESCRGDAATSIEFEGSPQGFLWLCENLTGFAAGAFVRSLEKVCAASLGDDSDAVGKTEAL